MMADLAVSAGAKIGSLSLPLRYQHRDGSDVAKRLLTLYAFAGEEAQTVIPL
jgi:hypothetical protein